MAQILQLTGQLSFKPVITEEKEITANGTYLPAEGKDGFSKVTVNVQPELEEKTVSANGTYIPTTGKDGFSKVTVNVQAQPTLQELNIYNGDIQEYTPEAGVDGFSKVTLDAMPYQISLSEIIAQAPYGSNYVQRGLYSELSIYNDVEPKQ